MKALQLAPLFVAVCAASAQTPLTFEVASVKRATSGANGWRGGCRGIDSTYKPGQNAPAPLGRCVITDARLSHLVANAFGLDSIVSLKGASDWMIATDERYNVEGKAEQPEKTTEAQLREMLRNLLIERFQLKFHQEQKEQPGFALLAGKNGSKLKPWKSGDEETLFNGQPMLKPMMGEPVTIALRKYTMDQLAHLLTLIGNRGPIVDETGLTGTFDVTLAWDEDRGPALTTAIQSQLGLRLEPRKIPVPYFVIDSAQRPGSN